MDTFTIQLLLGLLGVIALGVYAIAAAVWLRGDPDNLDARKGTETEPRSDDMAQALAVVEAGFQKLHEHITRYANMPVSVTLNATTAPLPEVTQEPLASSFPNADALRAIVNMMGSGLTQAVRLDGVEIHPGADPAMSYMTQPDGPVRIA